MSSPCTNCLRVPESGGRCETCGTKWEPDEHGTLQRHPSFVQKIAQMVTTDPMVPRGYIEVRDGDGKLLSRHKIGGLDAE